MRQVRHLLEDKGDAVYSIAPEAPVLDAIRMMAERGVGALLVLRGDALAGIVTERDYARKVALAGRSSKDARVADIMTTQVLCVGPRQTTQECMALMTNHRLRHLPVLDEDKLIGLVSIGDLVKDIISEQQFIIEQLEHYIAGNR
jgi:CBS domain-containing protein